MGQKPVRKVNVRTFESISLHGLPVFCLSEALAAMQSKVLGTLEKIAPGDKYFREVIDKLSKPPFSTIYYDRVGDGEGR